MLLLTGCRDRCDLIRCHMWGGNGWSSCGHFFCEKCCFPQKSGGTPRSHSKVSHLTYPRGGKQWRVLLPSFFLAVFGPGRGDSPYALRLSGQTPVSVNTPPRLWRGTWRRTGALSLRPRDSALPVRAVWVMGWHRQGQLTYPYMRSVHFSKSIFLTEVANLPKVSLERTQLLPLRSIMNPSGPGG